MTGRSLHPSRLPLPEPQSQLGGRDSQGGRAQQIGLAERAQAAQTPLECGQSEGGASSKQRAQRLILATLSRGPKTRAELARVLRTQGVNSEVAGVALEYCASVGLIDDARYAALWAASRSRSKRLSRAALEDELRSKGVSAHHIDAALAGLEDTDRQRAHELVQARLPAEVDWSRATERDKHRRRLLGVLMRKGYSYDLAREAVLAHTPPHASGA